MCFDGLPADVLTAIDDAALKANRKATLERSESRNILARHLTATIIASEINVAGQRP